MSTIEKQLRALIKIADKNMSTNPEYFNALKFECEIALINLEGGKEDLDFQADTEYYNEMIA